MKPSIMGKILIDLGEEGEGGAVVCKVHEFQHFHKMLEMVQKESEPLGGSQQALMRSSKRRAIAMALR